MAKDKKILANLDMDTSALVKSAMETKKEIEKLKEQQDKLISKGKEASAQFTVNAAALKSLEAAYKSQQQALAAQTAEDGKLLTVKKAVKQAVQEVNNSENDYLANNKELIALKKQLNSNDEDYEKRLAAINAKLQENNNWLQENGSAHAKLVTTMSDYKDQVTDSFNSINVLNGGLSGLISRAQEAGGAGPLLKGAFEGMSQGIVGMTKSAMSFIATPIGAILAAIALVIALVQNSMERGTESAGKITKIFTTFSVITDKLMGLLEPLGDFLIDGIAAGFEMAGKAADAALGFISDGLAFLGFDDAAQGVKDFTEDVKNTAAETTNLKNAQEKLAAQMAVQEVNNEKAKQQIDALIKKSEDQTASEKDRLAALTEAATIEKNNLNERKKLADEAYNQAVRKAALNKGLTAEEVAALQEGGAAYAEKMMKVKGFTQEEIDALQKGQTERMRLSGEETKMVQDQEAARQKVRDDAAAKRKAAEDKRRQDQKNRLSERAQTLQLELDLYMQQEADKERTYEEELAFLKDVKARKKAIIEAEYQASDKKETDNLQKKLALGELEKDNAKEVADVSIAHAKAEFEAWMEQHKTKIDATTELTKEVIAQEKARLDEVQAAKLRQLEIEKNTNQQIIDDKKAKNIELSKIDKQFLADKEAIEKEAATSKKDLDNAVIAQAAQNRQTQLEIEATTATTKYEQDVANEQLRYEAEQADLKERLDAKLITEEQYNALNLASENEHTKNLKALDKAVLENKMQLTSSALGDVSKLLGQNSAAGKAAAIAQTTIDTYLAAQKAYTSQLVVGDPSSPVRGAIAAATAVASGLANVKKITATKTPKAAKGALFNIGGNRHSNGGTMFTGADGTRFEAEQGELIGVMNRNAAAHFMAFNNAFPAGGSSTPNYFANGGIVSREMATPGMNIDELAAKIAAANASIPAPVVSVQDIITQGNSYVQVRDAANF